MPITTDQQLRLPTEVELERATEAFKEAIEEAMSVTLHIHSVSRLGFENTEQEIREAQIEGPLGFEDIGRMFSWLENASQYVKEIRTYIEDAAKQLSDLDYVRHIRSRNG
jgi:hypothetical protein